MTFLHTPSPILRRRKAVRTGGSDTNVALIMFVMMSLVFGPVIGVHLFAAFAPAAASSSVVSRESGPSAIPPG